MTREKLELMPTRQLKRIVHDGQFDDDTLEMAQEIIDSRGYQELGFADPNFSEFETDTLAMASSTANYILADTE